MAEYLESCPARAPAGPMMLKGEEPKAPQNKPPQMAVRRPASGVEPLAMPSPMERETETTATRSAGRTLSATARASETGPTVVRTCAL
eukprot:765795-Hanusia_phi.AAC.3